MLKKIKVFAKNSIIFCHLKIYISTIIKSNDIKIIKEFTIDIICTLQFCYSLNLLLPISHHDIINIIYFNYHYLKDI